MQALLKLFTTLSRIRGHLFNIAGPRERLGDRAPPARPAEVSKREPAPCVQLERIPILRPCHGRGESIICDVAQAVDAVHLQGFNLPPRQRLAHSACQRRVLIRGEATS